MRGQRVWLVDASPQNKSVTLTISREMRYDMIKKYMKQWIVILLVCILLVEVVRVGVLIVDRGEDKPSAETAGQESSAAAQYEPLPPDYSRPRREDGHIDWSRILEETGRGIPPRDYGYYDHPLEIEEFYAYVPWDEIYTDNPIFGDVVPDSATALDIAQRIVENYKSVGYYRDYRSRYVTYDPEYDLWIVSYSVNRPGDTMYSLSAQLHIAIRKSDGQIVKQWVW